MTGVSRQNQIRQGENAGFRSDGTNNMTVLSIFVVHLKR